MCKIKFTGDSCWSLLPNEPGLIYEPSVTIPWPSTFINTDEMQVARVRELLKEFESLRARLNCKCCAEHTTGAEKQRYNDLLTLLGDLIKW